MKKWLIGILGVVVASLLVAWLTGQWSPKKYLDIFDFEDQKELADRLSQKYNFFSAGDDSWSRPNSTGFSNEFFLQGEVIQDKATGLTWQRGGSPESLPFAQIDGYLRQLNSESWGGYNDWRLPNLAEAWTLLEPNKTEQGLYLDPIFDSTQRWIWSSTIAEKSDKGYGWFIFFEGGYPIFQNAWGSHAYIRAVRGPLFN